MTATGTERNVYGRELSDEDVARGLHRELAGGLWDELGRLQRDFLVGEGLRPQDRLLDVGCGCLRAGVHFVRYLDPGRYYGLDVNASLVRAGYDVELRAAGLQARLPRANLLVTRAFEAWRFGRSFDFALAQSLFTHLPAAEVRACLAAVAVSLRPGGRFYATFFEAPAGAAQERLEHAPGGIVSYADRDPFHYRLTDLVALADPEVWDARYLGEWGHPRAQRMLRFDRR
jgi:SAM-dependent methyltransferase